MVWFFFISAIHTILSRYHLCSNKRRSQERSMGTVSDGVVGRGGGVLSSEKMMKHRALKEPPAQSGYGMFQTQGTA